MFCLEIQVTTLIFLKAACRSNAFSRLFCYVKILDFVIIVTDIKMTSNRQLWTASVQTAVRQRKKQKFTLAVSLIAVISPRDWFMPMHLFSLRSFKRCAASFTSCGLLRKAGKWSSPHQLDQAFSFHASFTSVSASFCLKILRLYDLSRFDGI